MPRPECWRLALVTRPAAQFLLWAVRWVVILCASDEPASKTRRQAKQWRRENDLFLGLSSSSRRTPSSVASARLTLRFRWTILHQHNHDPVGEISQTNHYDGLHQVEFFRHQFLRNPLQKRSAPAFSVSGGSSFNWERRNGRVVGHASEP